MLTLIAIMFIAVIAVIWWERNKSTIQRLRSLIEEK